MSISTAKGSPRWRLPAILVLLAGGMVTAENIDPAGDGSQYAWCENIGWINAEPQGDGGPGPQVGDSGLTGWMWAENAGWVSLSCQNTSSCGTNDYGVSNDGKGNLSGFAWGENIGWINFRTDAGSDCCVADGRPGCADSGCEGAICAVDPYCCHTVWDGTCAGEAAGNPACSPGCTADPWGVEIDGSTGDFSGFAWSESAGWINFGTFPAASHQIETAWRCPDPDLDGVCSAHDNCPSWWNPILDTVRFDQQVRGASNKVDFVWSLPVAWQLATGTFTTPASIGTWAVDFHATGSGTVYPDPGFPSGGQGYWYVFRPDCPAGSYSTGSPSELPGRDAALIP